ncbi:MAG TPA: hypothetical protein VFJ30_00985 [Phycisphaerae bacterium]|nr:hypothetical protein [Phycisphaerae bacterium]
MALPAPAPEPPVGPDVPADTHPRPPAVPTPRPPRPDVRLAVRATRRNWPPPRKTAIHLTVIAAIIALFIWLWAIWR